jgi:hypothetical protein
VKKWILFFVEEMKMKKAIFLCVVLLAASVNAFEAVTYNAAAPALPLGGLLVDTWVPDLVSANNATTQYYGSTVQDIIGQNFKLNNAITLDKVAIQLDTTGTSTGSNLYSSSSDKLPTVIGNRISVWQYTGAEDWATLGIAGEKYLYSHEYLNAANAPAPTRWTQLASWNLVWPMSDPDPNTGINQMYRTFNSLITGWGTGAGWFKLDVPNTLNLDPDVQYGVRVEFMAKSISSSTKVKVGTGRWGSLTGDPAYQSGRGRATKYWGIDPATGLWAEGYGPLGTGYPVTASWDFAIIAPEPATIALLSLGGLLLRRRSK